MPAPTSHQGDQGNFAETIARIAPHPVELVNTGSGRLFAVPEGYSLQTDSALQKLQPTPARKAGTVKLKTLSSFVQYVNQHKQPESQLYAAVNAKSADTPLVVTAVLNDHMHGDLSASPAGWCDFKAILSPDSSPEWKTWIGANGQKMSQMEFATFIEDNIHCFAGNDVEGGKGFPSGGEMLQMALQFEASSDKRIRSAVRLQSGGVQIEHVDTDDAATVSRMQAFDRFRLGLAPFWRGDSYPLEAKLRYRNTSGGLTLWFDLVRPDRVVDHAVEEMLAQIETGTAITPIFGSIV